MTNPFFFNAVAASVGILLYAAGAVVGYMASRTGAIWGRGIGVAALASFAAPWIAVSFIVGFEAGVIEASLDYIDVQESGKRYGDM